MVKKISLQNSFISAIGWVALIILAEYMARRFVVRWLPILAAAPVNDMLAFVLCYVPLVWFSVPGTQRHLHFVSQAIRSILAQAKTRLPWVSAIAVLILISLFIFVDQWLWGKVQLPSWQSPYLSPLLFPQLAPVLVVASLLLVNGIFIPVVEEWLWRGLIQPRFIGRLGLVSGLLLTAVLFSLKHAIVDASLGRLLSLICFGIVLGIVAHRKTWESAALTHILANSISTITILLFSR